MSNGSIINRIEGILNDLPKSEKKIGQAVLANPEFTTTASIHKLAQKADASGAAVIRFCKSIGLQSFPELKRQLSLDLAQPQKKGYYDIEPNEDFHTITEKLVSNMIQTMNDTASQLDEAKVLEACELLGEADTIYTYGVGASWLVAEDISQKWLRAGKHVLATQDAHVLAMAFATGKKKAVFLAISNSGETSEVLQLVDQAKLNNVIVISLTRFGSNKLKEKADLSLETSRAPEAEIRSTATSSRQAQLLVIDILFYYYASHHYDEMIQQIKHSREATNRFRE
ncbi:TPA_asm: MurR/RpiR family transcriptional regulator [Listeria monocytogenes]|nr:MurR/RpiR family transcriptional regulator [Listeria monocytogenes]